MRTRFLPLAICAALCLGSGSASLSAFAQAPLLIYSNNLVNGFQDWSWGTHSFTNAAVVHSAPLSIMEAARNGEAFSLEHNDINTSLYSSLTFWINGGGGGQLLHLSGLTNAYGSPVGSAYSLGTLPANTWQLVSVPLATIGLSNVLNFERFWLQNVGGSTNAFYVDDIQLTAKSAPSQCAISINPSLPLRTVDRRMFGINTAVWDSDLGNAMTSTELADMGLQFLRFPGGSLSDDYHWASNTTDSNTWRWGSSFDDLGRIATNGGAAVIVTVNYGTGSPAEAAAWVTYAKNAHYHIAYWEVGNENYGTWETDSNALPHDPYTYAVRAQSYLQAMRAADPTIKIGVVLSGGEDANDNGYSAHPATNSATGQTHYGWSPVVLATLRSLGAQPDFAIYHWYPEYTDAESDPLLLLGTSNWSGDASNLRQMIANYYGPAGTNVELLVTENNSNAGAQGKQSTSIVNGLYYADSVAHLMQTEFNSYTWWDLRNGVDQTGNMDPTLYGWRQYGDIGTINGLGNVVSNRYPQYYTMKLMKFFARPGDTVLSAGSDYAWLTAFGTRATNGSLRMLVINKDPATTFNAQISLGSFAPAPNATVYSYSIPQDNANRTGLGSPDIATNTATVSNPFTASFAPYSASVYVFPPGPVTLTAQALPGSSQFVLQMAGDVGAPYVLQSSSDLTHWASVSTNWMAASPTLVTNSVATGAGAKFWRAVWQP